MSEYTLASPLLWDVLPTNIQLVLWLLSRYIKKGEKKNKQNKKICIWKKLVKLDQLSWFVGTVWTEWETDSIAENVY